MDVRRGMLEVRKLKSEGYSSAMLAIMIGEILSEYQKGKKLTIPERLILGLRYSEFLVTDDTPISYEQAEIKRVEYLKQFGLTPKDINDLCKKHCNLM